MYQIKAFTLAVDGATPSPVLLLTAKALAIQEVIVSGTVVFIETCPFDLKQVFVKLTFG